jgi:hypothetical protein
VREALPLPDEDDDAVRLDMLERDLSSVPTEDSDDWGDALEEVERVEETDMVLVAEGVTVLCAVTVFLPVESGVSVAAKVADEMGDADVDVERDGRMPNVSVAPIVALFLALVESSGDCESDTVAHAVGHLDTAKVVEEDARFELEIVVDTRADAVIVRVTAEENVEVGLTRTENELFTGESVARSDTE